jgi:hypothetical protein
MAKHDALASTNNNKNVDPAMAEHDALASPDNNRNKIEDPALTTQDVTASLTNSKGDVNIILLHICTQLLVSRTMNVKLLSIIN